jgi:hypothetical protein
MPRTRLLTAALERIPRILTLQDRNPHSPTYGCFDRDYWHYKVIDFPSGMAQEFVWPLALAYAVEAPENPYFGDPSLKEWIIAGLHFAARSAHRDGSCDDYFPHERAAGAAAFSLMAGLDAYRLLELTDASLLAFFRRRAFWLAHHQEAGKLANHQALITLCFATLHELTGEAAWQTAAEKRLALVLSWQHAEGWFQEYDGCDPGYQTLTLSCLARLYEYFPTATLADALTRAVRCAAHFVHPDGSYGGEYGSRNTYAYFPHGFELVGRWMPEALTINDRVLDGLARGLAPCFDDDHLAAHQAWNFLLAYRDFVTDRPPGASMPEGRTHLAGAGLLIERRGELTLYTALNKGGVFKLFQGDRLLLSDTQLSVLTHRGRQAVAHLAGHYEVSIATDTFAIAGTMGWAKTVRMTPVRLLLLRAFASTVGRAWPNLTRRLLQRLLILGKSPAPYQFRREFRWEAAGLTITDTLQVPDWKALASVGLSGHQTSIYVAMSRTYQAGQRQPWRDLTEQVRTLPQGEPLQLTRSFP